VKGTLGGPSGPLRPSGEAWCERALLPSLLCFPSHHRSQEHNFLNSSDNSTALCCRPHSATFHTARPMFPLGGPNHLSPTQPPFRRLTVLSLRGTAFPTSFRPTKTFLSFHYCAVNALVNTFPICRASGRIAPELQGWRGPFNIHTLQRGIWRNIQRTISFSFFLVNNLEFMEPTAHGHPSVHYTASLLEPHVHSSCLILKQHGTAQCVVLKQHQVASASRTTQSLRVFRMRPIDEVGEACCLASHTHTGHLWTPTCDPCHLPPPALHFLQSRRT
jgi:hypothetical protein